MLQSKRVAEWTRKHDPHICFLRETQLRTKVIYRLKVKGWKNYSVQMSTQHLWDTATAVPRGKFIALQAYLTKIERSQRSDLTLHLQELEEQQTKPRASGRKEIRSEQN